MINIIGKEFVTKNYGVATVVGAGDKYGYYSVSFKNTGCICSFRQDAIRRGEIRDPAAKSVMGIASTGKVKTKGEKKPLYDVWKNMIKRCYDSEAKTATAYYGKVFVCDRWMVFKNFLDDISLIEGWDEELFKDRKLVLDKDKKQRFKDKKVYSVDTCNWISREENNKYQDGQQKFFEAISPSGQRFVSYNITEFAREHGLGRRQISAVLHGRCLTTLGWKFKFLDKDIV